MNFTTLQARVAERCGLTSTDASIGSANTGAVANLVNAALRTIEVDYPQGWDWLRTHGFVNTVSGTETYTFATISTALLMTDISKIVSVSIKSPSGQGHIPLERISRAEAQQLYPATTSSGPAVCWIEGRTLGLRPAPDGVYQLLVTAIKTEVDLVDGANTPAMPSSYHDAIVEKAAELHYRRVHDLPNAAAAAGAYKDWRMRMLSHQRPYVGPGAVRARSGSWG